MKAQTILKASLALSAAGLMAAPAAAEDYWQFNLGADYSSGDYGEATDTDQLVVPVGVKVQTGNFFASASTSYVTIDGPADVIPGDGGSVPGGSTAATDKRSGMGDVYLKGGYTVRAGDRTFVDLIGKVKVPTASKSKAIGTGTAYYQAEAEVFHVFGPVTAAARAGYRFNDASQEFPLNDVWLAGGGLYYGLDKVTLGLDYDWREGSYDTSPDISELTGSATVKLNDQLRLQGYAYTGFADGSPDLGGGAQVLYRFGM